MNNPIRFLCLISSLLAGITSCTAPKENEQQQQKIDFSINYDDMDTYFKNIEEINTQALQFSTQRNDKKNELKDLIFSEIFLKENEIELKTNTALFNVDLNKKNPSGNHQFHANTDYFEALQYIDATNLKKEVKIIGKINTEALQAHLTEKSLVRILLRLPIVVSYAHLHADFYLINEIDNKEIYSVSYKVQWHYCTNDCYDPIYKMKIEVNKSSGEISVIRI